jgi:hypothetical protein
MRGREDVVERVCARTQPDVPPERRLAGKGVLGVSWAGYRPPTMMKSYVGADDMV